MYPVMLLSVPPSPALASGGKQTHWTRPVACLLLPRRPLVLNSTSTHDALVEPGIMRIGLAVRGLGTNALSDKLSTTTLPPGKPR